MAVFSAAYLGPVEYYARFLASAAPLIEANETYSRQSWRNRCRIAGANGILDLSIPVCASNHTAIKDVTIDYSSGWNISHWRSIESAYRSSAFFIYYDYELQPFFDRQYRFLLDFNAEIQTKIIELLGLSVSFSFTESFVKNYQEFPDYRSSIHPKKTSVYQPPPYRQVFADRHGFLPNLSIIDLLFNMGPEAGEYLQKLTSTDSFLSE
jgi:hypothetical protein